MGIMGCRGFRGIGVAVVKWCQGGSRGAGALGVSGSIGG